VFLRLVVVLAALVLSVVVRRMPASAAKRHKSVVEVAKSQAMHRLMVQPMRRPTKCKSS
jgi:hypothetical protein